MLGYMFVGIKNKHANKKREEKNQRFAGPSKESRKQKNGR
jgi:hypothetical protein